jgi:hypothetical protein
VRIILGADINHVRLTAFVKMRQATVVVIMLGLVRFCIHGFGCSGSRSSE